MFVNELVIARLRSFTASSSTTTHACFDPSQISAIRAFALHVTTRCATPGYSGMACSSTATPSGESPDRENEIHRYFRPGTTYSARFGSRSVLATVDTSQPHFCRSNNSSACPI